MIFKLTILDFVKMLLLNLKSFLQNFCSKEESLPSFFSLTEEGLFDFLEREEYGDNE